MCICLVNRVSCYNVAMPKAKTKPKVKYVQVAALDQSVVDDVFNYLFDKLLKQ
jgi:hypothetical protein